MSLEKYHKVYFLGIGGIGMSALARWFNLEGRTIAGYDKTPTPLTDELINENIAIHFDDAVENIPADILNDMDNTLVIYTPAIPKDHKEWNYLKEKGFAIKKRSEVLGMITEGRYTIAVAGTHGKTTTSSMIAHILYEAGRNSVGFMGGVLQNYNSNLILKGNGEEDTIVVVEADEFDRSFLTLKPNIAVVTSADADHLDIYGSHDSLKKSFSDFIARINKKGLLLINDRISNDFDVDKTLERETYSIKSGDHKAESVKAGPGYFEFDYSSKGKSIRGIRLNVPGFHNVENAVAAISVCLRSKVDPELIKSAIAKYKGVKRRFDYQVKREDLVYIDDYAHHPTEIHALMDSVKALYPDKKITAIFQPHLFTRTRDFAKGFSESLSKADELIMLNVYPARELPIAGVTSQMILDDVTIKNKKLLDDDELLSELKNKDIEVLLTVGAGDIDRFVKPIKELLESRV